MRLFAALYPDPTALDAAERALDALGTARGSASGPLLLRWTPRELLHVTLAFYGEAPPGAVPDLTGALAAVARDTPPLDLHLHGAGVFDRRVLWLGVGGDTDGLRDLSAAVAAAGDDVGLRLDRRPRQRAHVTVARAGSAARGAARVAAKRARRRREDAGPDELRRALEEPAAALAVYRGPAWTASELCLVESDRGDASGRPVHRVVERFPLDARAPDDRATDDRATDDRATGAP